MDFYILLIGSISTLIIGQLSIAINYYLTVPILRATVMTAGKLFRL